MALELLRVLYREYRPREYTGDHTGDQQRADREQAREQERGSDDATIPRVAHHAGG